MPIASPGITSTAQPPITPDVPVQAVQGDENNVFMFVAGWVLMFTVLSLINKTQLGHVVVYYTLLLIIMLILVTEYAQIAPLFLSISSIGQYTKAGGQ